MNKAVLIIAVALTGLAAGYTMNLWLENRQITAKTPETTVTATTKEVRPAFALKDVNDKLRHIKEWDGQVIMINFWATWCPPCRREMPAFIKLYEKYKDRGFTIIGVALDEKQAVIDFIDPMGVEYPVLIGDEEGIPLTRRYGNRLGVLPYTVFIDRQGRIIARHRNELKYEEAEKLIKPLL